MDVAQAEGQSLLQQRNGLKKWIECPGQAELLAGIPELALINLLAAPEPERNTGTGNRCPGSSR